MAQTAHDISWGIGMVLVLTLTVAALASPALAGALQRSVNGGVYLVHRINS